MTLTRTTIYTSTGEIFTGDPLDRSRANHIGYLDTLGEALGSDTGWVRILMEGDTHIFPTRNISHVAVRVLDTNQKDT